MLDPTAQRAPLFPAPAILATTVPGTAKSTSQMCVLLVISVSAMPRLRHPMTTSLAVFAEQGTIAHLARASSSTAPLKPSMLSPRKSIALLASSAQLESTVVALLEYQTVETAMLATSARLDNPCLILRSSFAGLGFTARLGPPSRSAARPARSRTYKASPRARSALLGSTAKRMTSAPTPMSASPAFAHLDPSVPVVPSFPQRSCARRAPSVTALAFSPSQSASRALPESSAPRAA